MSLFNGYDIATSGMNAQRTRINVVSANIANAKTTHSKDGGPYVKQNITFAEIVENKNVINDRLGQLEQKFKSYDAKYNAKNIDAINYELKGVEVKSISDSKEPPKLRYEPNHPDANKQGYVAYPNINPVVEMVDLIESMRAYESNVSAFKTQKQLDTTTIDILQV